MRVHVGYNPRVLALTVHGSREQDGSGVNSVVSTLTIVTTGELMNVTVVD
jgi:hypothetical protein